MSTTVLDVPLSEETRERLKEIATRARRSEAEIAASLIEGALAADQLEVQIIRERLAQADAGGPFARHEDVLAWLKALSEGAAQPKGDWTWRSRGLGLPAGAAQTVLDELRQERG